MARIRLCQCGAPPLYGPWCWACSHEQERRREPLGVIAWNAADIDGQLGRPQSDGAGLWAADHECDPSPDRPWTSRRANP